MTSHVRFGSTFIYPTSHKGCKAPHNSSSALKRHLHRQCPFPLEMFQSARNFSSSARRCQLKPGLRFRDFVQALRQEKDLVEITKEIDPYLEVGAITRRASESQSAAPLFTNLKAEKPLFSILGAPASLRGHGNDTHARVAHHLGLAKDSHIKDIIDFLIQGKTRPLVKPHEVSPSEAPVKENLLSSEEIDFTKWPSPTLHPNDGGPYLQTYGMFILQTPDGRWTNWSVARGQVVGKNKIAGLVINPQHIRLVADEWAKIGKGDKIPVALAFGVPPAAILVSSMPIPEGQNEADYIGTLLGESLPLVKCETNDLLVPATSEIVMEGTLDLKELTPEGPFGEMHGYVFNHQAHPCPTYTFTSVSHRDNPILPISNPGTATDETHTLIGVLNAVEAKQLAIEHDLPVIDIFAPYEAQALWFVVKVDTKKLQALNTTPEEFAKKIGDIYFRHKVGFTIHEIILVGDDVDIFNIKDVLWAYATRHTPYLDQYYFHDVISFPLAPFISQSGLKQGGKVVTDCLFPQQYKKDVEFTKCDFDHYDTQLKAKIEQEWESYGYKK